MLGGLIKVSWIESGFPSFVSWLVQPLFGCSEYFFYTGQRVKTNSHYGGYSRKEVPNGKRKEEVNRKFWITGL